MVARRAARDRVTIRRFHYPASVGSTGSIVEAIYRALTARTRLVMIGHMVLIGQINPVLAIADLIASRHRVYESWGHDPDRTAGGSRSWHGVCRFRREQRFVA
jgi:hypothetical protein